jgi:hypothetical protein
MTNLAENKGIIKINSMLSIKCMNAEQNLRLI